VQYIAPLGCVCGERDPAAGKHGTITIELTVPVIRGIGSGRLIDLVLNIELA
jgi:hypothetical protein